MSDDYKKDIVINKYDLQNEWVQHAQLFCEWGEKEAEAIYERDKKDQQLELKRAELSSDIRKNPVLHGLSAEKAPTEAAISAAILIDKDFKKLQEECLLASKNVRIMTIAKLGFEHRKKALEKITELTLSGYHAEPRETKGIKEKREAEVVKNREEHYDALSDIRRRK